MEIFYKPSFVRAFQRLEKDLQDEVIEKVTRFKDVNSHKSLKVHALHGELKGFYSFSVNYRYRIVFVFARGKREAHLIAIGDHKVYQ